MNLKAFATAALAALVVVHAAPARAQVSGVEPAAGLSAPAEATDPSDTYGLTSETSYVIGAYAFDGFSPTTEISGQGGTGDRFVSAGGVILANAYLPNGALINRIEVQGCDTGAGTLNVTLFSNTTTGGVQSEINHGSVSTTGTPGCGFFSAALAPAVTVNNQVRSYLVQVSTSALNNTTRFAAVRLFYRLQVSPAPGVATFPNDVPTTHPVFRFVEALAAAGITGGCGAGSFCPDAAVTRGQMAVFLAAALGLHFPN